MIRGTLQILYPSPCQSKECTTYHSGANANIYHYIPCTPSHQLGEGLSQRSMMIIYGLNVISMPLNLVKLQEENELQYKDTLIISLCNGQRNFYIIFLIKYYLYIK